MLVVAGLAVVVAGIWSIRGQRTGTGRRTAQLVAGLVCGVAAALAVAVPFADVVPDAEEGMVAAGGAAAVAIVGVGISLVSGGRTRRGRDQVPRS